MSRRGNICDTVKSPPALQCIGMQPFSNSSELLSVSCSHKNFICTIVKFVPLNSWGRGSYSCSIVTQYSISNGSRVIALTNKHTHNTHTLLKTIPSSLRTHWAAFMIMGLDRTTRHLSTAR